jgi:hypothetical protein
MYTRKIYVHLFFMKKISFLQKSFVIEIFNAVKKLIEHGLIYIFLTYVLVLL